MTGIGHHPIGLLLRLLLTYVFNVPNVIEGIKGINVPNYKKLINLIKGINGLDGVYSLENKNKIWNITQFFHINDHS